MSEGRAFTASVLTVSDGVKAGTRRDESGDALRVLLEKNGYRVAAMMVVPDEADEIERALRDLQTSSDLIVTTGGTGFGPRDVTPEATKRVIEREAPGLVILMITAGMRATDLAALSRGIAGSAGSTLIVNLPGSPRGATENLQALLAVMPHALEVLTGDTEHRT
ncbi:MAG TPA: MogA/MoaB family molybdenum cofactor biosynthesis protein [Acidimicrobiia bacterium]